MDCYPCLVCDPELFESAVSPVTDSDDPKVEAFWAKLVRLWDEL